MSYHQWLSCAPKHHLTSSAQDGFSKSRSNNARPVPHHYHSGTSSHTAASMPPPEIPRSKAHQVALSAPTITQPFVETNGPRRILSSSLSHQAITPPSQGDDYVPYENIVHLNGGYESSYGTSHRSASSLPPSRVGPELAVSIRPPPSRDSTGHLFARKGSAGGGNQTALPSPPSSPQRPVKVLPSPTKSKYITTASRQQPAETWKPTYSDPMMQTSTDPHFWSTNCTVLKADTHLKAGSVISPTCMVGLPFGSMTEMVAPDSPVDMKGLCQNT